MAKEKARGDLASRRKRAADLAGTTIDDQADGAANANEKAKRKQRLLEGPEEFRAVRVDRSKQPRDR
jgi:hypothetical protein